MMHFNKFYEELRTIDYGLLCVDLYHLAELPLISKPPQAAESNKWASGYKEGSLEDQNWAIDKLREISQQSPHQFQWGSLEFDKSNLEEVTEDWWNAVWIKYFDMNFDLAYFHTAFDNKWIDRTPGLMQIEEPMSDLLPLQSDKIQVYLNRLVNLASKLADSSSALWSNLREIPYFPGEPLWISLRHFELFHRYISKNFNTINYPPFGKINKLYFGRDFLDRYDILIFRKVELIYFFISEINTLTGVLPRIENSAKDSSEEKTDNKFNDMPLSEVKQWFMQLATRTNKDGQHFLTEDQVWQFINRAFLKNKPDSKKLKVNYGRDGKWNFVRLFFDYYWHCTTTRRDNLNPLDERPNIRNEYIKLLTDNFEGFNFDEVKKNFSKKIGPAWII
ncbi:hypothetical protein EXU85_24305 [Spirosoma sp. KCTC 42546]|uniref:hypothetical protein n=1 Tax=Spirosoma sp. KCTC 42546 TaxID=2520506 RepID=UPI0011591085|nr:hypothetical protein [Spirosoma sp. KCTC 42546]QDK81561.1 hypothetical protein EXU85_24305 [Spirosoma sp. KCTC 42546]